jgi:hypothetical protein
VEQTGPLISSARGGSAAGAIRAHKLPQATLPGALATIVIVLGLAACGTGAPARVAKGAGVASARRDASTPPPEPVAPGAVVARVGPYTIAGAMLNRWLDAELSLEPASERPVPPHFSACVANLKAHAAAGGQTALGTAQLSSECQARYREVLETVLDRLIADDWLIGGARELSVPVGEHAVKLAVERYLHDHHASETAQLHSLLAGRTLADLELETRAKLATAAIHSALDERVTPVTHAELTSYYNLHQFEYIVAASRDLEIARTKSEAAAAKAKSEIASGASFASVVAKLGVPQPIDSGDGAVVGLQPHFYGEPTLNQAIFTATPGVLSGPIQTWFGYFVFEVTRIEFQRERPLAEVQASIRQTLLVPRERQALAAFVKRWTASWTARTDCSSRDVVPHCSQFSGSPLGPEEPPPLS